MQFGKDVMRLDVRAETERVCKFIREQTAAMRRDGAVVGMSGGIDSAITVALCSKALGTENVLGLLMPEKESNPVSLEYASRHAAELKIKTITMDITSVLKALGTYRNRDDFIRSVFPEYTSQYKFKIGLPRDLLSSDAFNLFKLTIEDGEGNAKIARPGRTNLHGIIAATDTKQRVRMVYLYYFAELNNYLVCGTTNRSEDVLGFFVKYGDGGVDIEPIAHLYKMQVYQLAEYLGVPGEIIDRVPSPDTFSSVQSDEEFYFRMSYDKLDPLLYAWENNIPIPEVCAVMSLSEEQVKRAFRDFSSKSRATSHLHDMPPKLATGLKLDTLLIS